MCMFHIDYMTLVFKYNLTILKVRIHAKDKDANQGLSRVIMPTDKQTENSKTITSLTITVSSKKC